MTMTTATADGETVLCQSVGAQKTLGCWKLSCYWRGRPYGDKYSFSYGSYIAAIHELFSYRERLNYHLQELLDLAVVDKLHRDIQPGHVAKIYDLQTRQKTVCADDFSCAAEEPKRLSS